MRKFILTILIILFSASVIKAERNLFETSSTLMFINKKESLKLEIVYNNDENICLYVRYNKPMTESKFEDGIYKNSSIQPNTAQAKPVTIYFWLNNYDGAKQKCIYINTTNGAGSRHTIHKSHYNAIASNLHSISVGNKWKLVKKNESHIVREYFINKLTEYKDREVNAYVYDIRRTKNENSLLETEIKNLNSANTQLLIENTELKTNLRKANETIKSLNDKTSQPKMVSNTPKVTSKPKKVETRKLENKPKKLIVSYEKCDEYTKIVKTTEELEYESKGQINKLPKGSVLEIIEVGAKTTSFSIIKDNAVSSDCTIKTKKLMGNHYNVKKIVTEE